MDIDATVTRLVDAVESSDWDEARVSALDIVAWMNKGGFAPKLDFPTQHFLFGTIIDLIEKAYPSTKQA